MASIKIRAGGNGTFALIRDGITVSSGLTRAQAERLAAVMRWIEPGH